MKRVQGGMIVFALCIVATVWAPLPAVAKGPTQGIITGPGLAGPIRLVEPGARNIGIDLARVVEQSGFFEGAWGGTDDHGRLAQSPNGYLGPRYTITYMMGVSDRDSDTIIQYVYPYAEPVPITHMPPNQKYWGTNETVGAWYAARIGLRKTLIGLGLPGSGAALLFSRRYETTTAVETHAGSKSVGVLAATAALGILIAAVLNRRHRLGSARQ